MRNKNRMGETLTYKNTGSVKIAAGELVLVGALAGIAVADIQPAARGALDVTGVFTLPKSGGAIAQGELVFYQTDKTVGATETDYPVGHAWEAAAAGDATVLVKLFN